MKRFTIYILLFSLFAVGCKALTPQIPAPEPSPTPMADIPKPTEPAETPPTQEPANIEDMSERLKELGGQPCKSAVSFTCLTLTVPLDHFDSANTETIEVVFAVAPAREERKGMFIQAFPGGPGGLGISYASRDYFPRQITNSYDLVFFDQRGVGLSNPLECKSAYSAYFLDYLNFNDTIGDEGFDTPEEQQAAIQKARSFVDDCIAEIGIDPGKLKFFTTDQVAEDIESFRQTIGDDKFMLLGTSYGTSVAQTYARAHSDHLTGLILDGTQDSTLTGNEIAYSQRDGFNEVLLNVFNACDADTQCSSRMGGSSQDAYDELAQKLAEAPLAYEFSISGTKKVQGFFTFNMLDYTVGYHLYGPGARRNLMRAIASANNGDMSLLAKLYYNVSNIDPETGQYLGSPGFSDTMYFIVWCSDDAYYSGTSDERSARIMEEGQILNGLVPRLDLDVLFLGLTCAFWPSAPTAPVILEPLKAEGVPTFVLNATLDPATPFHEGKTVFENLENGYHIYVEGGEHVIYFSGQDCPNRYVDDFLLEGKLPDQREIVCQWNNAILGP